MNLVLFFQIHIQSKDLEHGLRCHGWARCNLHHLLEPDLTQPRLLATSSGVVLLHSDTAACFLYDPGTGFQKHLVCNIFKFMREAFFSTYSCLLVIVTLLPVTWKYSYLDNPPDMLISGLRASAKKLSQRQSRSLSIHTTWPYQVVHVVDSLQRRERGRRREVSWCSAQCLDLRSDPDVQVWFSFVSNKCNHE